MMSQIGCVDTQRNGGVKYSGPVHMDFNSVLFCDLFDLRHVIDIKRRSVAAVVRIFKGDQPRSWKMNIIGSDGRRNIGKRYFAVRLVGHGSRLNAAERSASSLFIKKNMGFITQYDLIASAAMG